VLNTGLTSHDFTVIFTGVLAMLILLFISAIMSASEVSYFSLQPKDISVLKNKKKQSYHRVLFLLSTPEKLLATILTTNNFVNIAFIIDFVWISNIVFDFSNSSWLLFLIQTVVVASLLLLFGEVIPKSLAIHNPIRMAAFSSSIIIVFQWIFSPIIYLLSKTTVFFRNKVKQNNRLNFNDLSDAIDLASTDLKDEKKILKGIVNFATIRVNEILVSRMDVKTVNIKDNFSLVLQTIKESGFSRIPVIKNNFDNIAGILYIKDLLPHLHKPDFKWQSLIRPPYFVPESKYINDLLEEFQQKKIHMAIVVDEYGGASGIVTLEDVLEEIVGNIYDEFDKEKPAYTRVDERTFEVEGKMLINDFCHIANIDDTVFDTQKADSETIAGLILQHTGTMPKENDQFLIDKFTFIIKKVDARRIHSVQIVLPQISEK
jgi:gliding motility-associated protein GldE